MSVRVLSAVIEHSEAEGTNFVVLLMLADHANGDGRCWPTADRIARRARVSRSTVFRAIEELEALGEVQREVRGKRAGGPNVYRVMPGYVDGGVGHSDPPRVGHSYALGVGHARHEGGGSTVTHRTVRNRKEPRAEFVSDVPDDFDPDISGHVADIRASLRKPK